MIDEDMFLLADVIRGMETMAVNKRKSGPQTNRHEDAEKYWGEEYKTIRGVLTQFVRENADDGRKV